MTCEHYMKFTFHDPKRKFNCNIAMLICLHMVWFLCYCLATMQKVMIWATEPTETKICNLWPFIENVCLSLLYVISIL